LKNLKFSQMGSKTDGTRANPSLISGSEDLTPTEQGQTQVFPGLEDLTPTALNPL